MPSRAAKRLARLEEICTALPEATCTVGGRAGEHRHFTVRGKTFGYYTLHEHGEDRIAFLCKAAPGEQDILIRMGPERYFIPKYIGHRGWIGLHIDLPAIDWAEITDLAKTSYRLVAPKTLAAKV